MPELILKSTGKPVYVSSEGLSDAIASGLYEGPSGDAEVNVELKPGLVGTTTLEDLSAIEARGATPERESSFRARERDVRIEREHGGPLDTAITGIENALDEASLGGFGALGELIGGDEYTERRLERAEANPYAAGIGTAAGIIVPALASGGTSTAARVLAANPLGAVTRIGTRIAKSGEAVGALSRAGRVAAGGAFEGAATGFGQGVQQLTDMAEPLSAEKTISALSSNMLFGGLAGAGAGVVMKGVERGFVRARAALDDAASRFGARSEISDEIAKLDAKGLRAAEKGETEALRNAERLELDNLKTAEKAEIEALEASRVGQRKEVADEIAALRREIKDQKHFLTTKDVKLPDVEGKASAAELGRVAAKATKQLDNLLDNPVGFAANPGRALDALQRQESAMVKLLDRAEDLRDVFKSDATGTRIKALDSIAPALERNRALQTRLGELAKPPTSARLTEIAEARAAIQGGSMKTSARLDEIAAARDVVQSGASKGFPQQMLEGAVFGNATAMAAPLGPLAPMLGAKVSQLVGRVVFGKLGAAQAKIAARASKAIASFLNVAEKVAPAVPVLSSRVLASTSFAPSDGRRAAKAKRKAGRPKDLPSLADLYHARAEEIRSQVHPGPDGRAVIRPDARERVADQLRVMDVVSPLAADRMESVAVRRIEFLASKMPPRPEVGGMQIGTDHWQPSDMEIRKFARIANAVEDPIGVIERLGAGSITPEEAEAVREVYPELYADIQRQIIEQLPSIQGTLPYPRRLALTIFSGIPVDPALDPRILHVLQASFVNEHGSEGGTQAPMPEPNFSAFGSAPRGIGSAVRGGDLTPAQKRQGL